MHITETGQNHIFIGNNRRNAPLTKKFFHQGSHLLFKRLTLHLCHAAFPFPKDFQLSKRRRHKKILPAGKIWYNTETGGYTPAPVPFPSFQSWRHLCTDLKTAKSLFILAIVSQSFPAVKGNSEHFPCKLRNIFCGARKSTPPRPSGNGGIATEYTLNF